MGRMRRLGAGGDREAGGPSAECGQPGILAVLAAHLVLALQFGIMRCGGIFYVQWKVEFDASDKETAGVESAMTFAAAFGGYAGGFLTRKFGCRVSGMLGGALAFVGLMCRCWVTSLSHLYITAAVAGSGFGISYNSVMVVVALHFTERYKTAHSLSCAGIGTGIMAVPPLVQGLIDAYGWRGAVLIASAIVANSSALCAFIRPPAPGRRRPRRGQADAAVPSTETEALDDPRPTVVVSDEIGTTATTAAAATTTAATTTTATAGIIGREATGTEDAVDSHELLAPAECASVDVTERHPKQSFHRPKSSGGRRGLFPVVGGALDRLAGRLGLHIMSRSYRFALLVALQIEVNMAYMGFVTYLVPYAQGAAVAPTKAAFLMTFLGIGSLAGRLGNGTLLSLRLAPEAVTAACISLGGGSLLLLLLPRGLGDSYGVMATVAMAQGFSSGFTFTVMIVFVRRFVGLANLAVCLGLLQITIGLGMLSGPVTAGWLLDLTGSYQVIFSVLAALYFVCALQMALIPLLRRYEPGIDH